MEFKAKVGKQEISVKENLLDRTIRYVSPRAGQNRIKAKMTTALAGAWHGASRSRRAMKGWKTRAGDADSDLLMDLPTLRSNSRDLIRNSPLAAGAHNTACTSVVGPGLKLKSEIDADALGLSEEAAREWERIAERHFGLWSSSRDCDITRTQNFPEMQDLVFRSVLESGDLFSLLPYLKVKGSIFNLKIQLIEADRVQNKGSLADTAKQAGGIKLNSHGAPISYNILNVHPGSMRGYSRESKEVPAFGPQSGRRNVLHHFRRLRPGQNRGIPYLAPVIEMLKQLERYTDAELMAAVVSGMFTVFIKTEGDQDLDAFAPEDETGSSPSDEDYKLGNGAIVGLGRDDSIETANPGRPNTAFDPFVQSILRQIGVALEMPYEVLIKHFTASYSAARASLLEAWRFFLTRRIWLSGSFCQPVYEAFIDEQVAEGRLIAPGYFQDPIIRQAYLGAQWIGRPQGQIDPKKENEADVIAEDRGWKTATENTAEKTGGDFEKKTKQRIKEVKMRKEGGLEVVQEKPLAPGQEQEEEPNPDKEETGDENT